MRTLTLNIGVASGALTLLLGVPALADDISAQQLLNMSLAQLSNIEVTSVSRKPEKASEAAAAVYVITQEDIKRSGATDIPDLLRMVPGIEVAQAGAHDWAVTSRGFNNQFANKLLVLIDGRTVYNPLFSGTFWQIQDVPLEEIDRIEVIRGPGATQWGANAVNGVINIITKSAKDTQGGYASASAGNMVKSQDSVRYGVKTGDDSYARIYAKYNDYAPEFTLGGNRSNDGWQKRQAGFRSDSKLTDQDSLTLQGDAYTSHEGVDYSLPSVTAPSHSVTSLTDIEASGSNVLGRWTRNFSPESSTATQVYLDNTQYKTSFGSYNAATADFDFQHTWTGWQRNEIVWGLGYRLIMDHNSPTFYLSLTPSERNDSFYSAFLQDKYTLHPDDVFLTLGSKFEHNPYSGFEVEPSARLSWLITDTQMTWASVSRAVHTPNRFTSDAQLALQASAGPSLVAAIGAPDLDSEELTAYEFGYRIQPVKNLSLDMAAFYNDYSKLAIGNLGSARNMGTYLLVPEIITNMNDAHSLGYEISATMDATKNWQLSASYSYLDLEYKTLYGYGTHVGTSPKNQFSLRSTYLFPYDIEMTNSLYYVDSLNTLNIPGYYRFDTKISHELMPGVEASLVGQNLLTAYHREFSAFLYQVPEEIGRSVYANLTFKF